MMTLNFFKFVFLNYLLCFSASYDPLLGKAYNDSGTVIRGMANSLSLKRHEWQMANGQVKMSMENYRFHAVLVANMNTDQESFCSGAIVTYTTLVTAAICVFDLNEPRFKYYNPANLKVIAGASNGMNIVRNVPVNPVENVKAIGNYEEHTERNIFEGGNELIILQEDLAVVRVQGKFIELHDKRIRISLVKLPDNTFDNKIRHLENNHKGCEVFGSGTFGGVTYSSWINKIPLRFYTAQVTLITFESCNRRTKIRGMQIQENHHICAVGTKEGVCSGGNGGGLRCIIDGNFKLVGIKSMQLGCGTETAPMIFTRVDPALDFINNPFPILEKSAQSSGNCIHNQLVAQYYGASLTIVLLVTHFIKSRF